jgi:chromosome segregation ATPase
MVFEKRRKIMADKTFGVKVSEELHDKVKEMIENSGDSAKEWFEKAVAFAEAQSIKQGSPDYARELSELEVHTSRIYELVSNMVRQSIYLKDAAVKEVADKLEHREELITQYQEKANNAIEESKIANEALKSLEKEKGEVSKQLEEMRATNENNQLLIREYKEKTDTLSGLVNKYQAFAEENEELKKEHAAVVERLQSQLKELSGQTRDQSDEIKELEQEVQSLKANHAVELERTIERKDFEREKALLEVERDYQEKLLQANEGYNDKIKQLYEEINSIRREYEQRVEQLKRDNS